MYWAGLELAAIGAVADNLKDFEWAIAAYDVGVSQIQRNGTLPLETARRRRALHPHLYALAPLVLLAEFGEANHIDLYAHANGFVHRLVNLSVAGLQVPASFPEASGVEQEIPKKIGAGQISWAPPYLRRFPNPALARVVHASPELSV